MFTKKQITLAVLTALLMSSAAEAYVYETPSLSEQTDGSTVFVTGGVGEDERTELDAAKAEYNLHVINTAKDGAFASNTAVEIRNAKGETVLASYAGPILNVKLAPGRYKLLVENEGMVQNKWVRAGSKTPANVQFVWNLPTS